MIQYINRLHASCCILPGVLQADPGTVRDYSQIFRLFCHEAQRVFHDRLINHEDKRYFNTILAEMSQKHFSQVRYRSCCVVCLLVYFYTGLLGSCLFSCLLACLLVSPP